MIPWQRSERKIEALRVEGVEAGVEVVEGAGRAFVMDPEIGVEIEEGVKGGNAWLTKFVQVILDVVISQKQRPQDFAFLSIGIVQVCTVKFQTGETCYIVRTPSPLNNCPHPSLKFT